MPLCVAVNCLQSRASTCNGPREQAQGICRSRSLRFIETHPSTPPWSYALSNLHSPSTVFDPEGSPINSAHDVLSYLDSSVYSAILYLQTGEISPQPDLQIVCKIPNQPAALQDVSARVQYPDWTSMDVLRARTQPTGQESAQMDPSTVTAGPFTTQSRHGTTSSRHRVKE